MSAPSLLFPPRFATGDTIGIAAPASPPDQPEIIDETIKRLTAQGFKIKPGKYLRRRDGYLAGSDEERAADINDFFADPEVKGIFALRGGYGSCRILPLLDYAVIRANPKPLVGYSDRLSGAPGEISGAIEPKTGPIPTRQAISPTAQEHP